MAWAILLLPGARRDLRGLDHAVSQRILKRLRAIEAEPLRAMKRLTGSKDFSLRVGDYRVICLPDAEKRILIVRRVGHRSVIYDS